MRLHRFYTEQPLGEELVIVESALIHQWLSVFRYKSEDEVVLFSHASLGFDYIYRIASASKKEVVLNFVSKKENIIPKEKLTLCMAVVKKDTFENVVRYATELGVSKIVPVLADHSEKKNLNFERLVAIATEAAEQSGRGNVPEISEIVTFKQAFEQNKGLNNIFASLFGENATNLVSKLKTNKESVLWVGPEGGWTEEEEGIARENGALLLKLTDTVLKADTAAVCAMSLVTCLR